MRFRSLTKGIRWLTERLLKLFRMVACSYDALPEIVPFSRGFLLRQRQCSAKTQDDGHYVFGHHTALSCLPRSAGSSKSRWSEQGVVWKSMRNITLTQSVTVANAVRHVHNSIWCKTTSAARRLRRRIMWRWATQCRRRIIISYARGYAIRKWLRQTIHCGSKNTPLMSIISWNSNRFKIISLLDSEQNLLQNEHYVSHHTLTNCCISLWNHNVSKIA